MFRGPGRLVFILLITFAATTARAADLDRHLREVERIRGLSFSAPVHAVTIDRSDLPARLREQLTRSLPYSVADWGRILETLLLIEPAGSADPFDRLIDLYQAQVLAYYDPQTSTYYALRQPPPAIEGLPAGIAPEESVIVHELTHALQDQHFGIGGRALALRANTDGTLAYHAVLEGEASLVMLASIVGQTGADFDALIRQPMVESMLASAAAGDFVLDPETPRYFAETLKFPYLQGLRFVIEAYRRGGWKALDRIHQDPPRSTREILHPADYFDGFRAAAFTGEPPLSLDARTVERLGQFHWSYLLGAANAVGWTSDRVSIVDDRWCDPTVLVESSWESEEAARRFHAAYATLLDERGIGFLSRVEGRAVRVAYGADPRLMERFLQ